MTDHQRGIAAAKNILLLRAHELSAQELAEAAVAAYLDATASKPVLAEAWKVKVLEWQMLPPPFATGPLRPTARMPLGAYTILEIFVGKDEQPTWFALLEGVAIGSGPTQDHAKAAAQQDYEARFLSALSPTQPVKAQGDNAEEPVAWWWTGPKGGFLADNKKPSWPCEPLYAHPCTSTPVVSQNVPGLEDKGGEVGSYAD